MDENYSVLLEANGELVEGHCKRRQSGILKASRSPLRTLKETDISQKLEPVGKFRRSSRRVSFAETKEIKEFVIDKIIQADVEDDEMISTLQCKQNMETYNTRDGDKDNLQEELGRDMMPQDTNCKIAGMDALLHAPLRTSLQSECCEHPQTLSKHQIFSISGLEVRRGEETVTSSESKFTAEFQKKIDFRCSLAELDSTRPQSSNMSHGKGEDVSDMLFSSVRHNTVPKHQKTIDFKSFLSRVKQTETENRIISMHSSFEEQIYKKATFPVTSPCKALELTTNSMFQNHTIDNLDANKIILFPDHDKEITRCHTVAINNLVLEKSDTCHSVKGPNNTEKLDNRGSLSLFLPQDKAVVFGEVFTGVTRNAIEPNDVQMIENVTNQNQPPVVTTKRNERSILPSSSSDGHTFTGFESLGKSKQNKAQGTTKRTSRSLDILSGYPDKTLLFLNDNDMDITKNHTGTFDNASFRKVPISTVGSSTFVPFEKTMVFSEANHMDITQCHTDAIESDHLEQVSNKALQPTKKNSRLSIPGSILTSLPNDKTMVFSETNDMDLTKCHTLNIDNCSLGPVPIRMSGSSTYFPLDKTMEFSEANHMDITQCHTDAIERGNLEQVSNKPLQPTRKNSRLSISGSILTSLPNDKTMVFSETNDMDLTKSHTLNIDNCSLGPVPIRTGGSSTSVPLDKTMEFSEANHMDITHSHTDAIDSGHLAQVSNKALQSTRKNSRLSIPGSILTSLPNDKTMVFSETNDMDLTQSHTLNIDNCLGPVPIRMIESSTSVPLEKTMMFSEANHMDIKHSHTDAIERGNVEQISNKALQSTRKNSRLSIPGSILTSLPNDKTMVFSETNDMDLTKSHTLNIDNCLGPVPIRMIGSSTSVPLEKTMIFSEENHMDITQCHTDAIESGSLEQVSNKPLQPTKKNSRLSIPGSILTSLPNEKTMVFSETNDMDLTKCHTLNIDNCSLGPVPIRTGGSSTSVPLDKTMEFSEANHMDITHSHTGAIEIDHLGQVSNKALQSTRKNSRLSIPGSILTSLPNDKTMVFSETNGMDLTKSHTLNIDNCLGPVPMRMIGSSTSVPLDKTMVFSEANNMDIKHSHTDAVERGNLEQVSNKALQSTRKNSRLSIPGSKLASLSNEKTMILSEANDMDLARSHTVRIDNGGRESVAICTVSSSAPFPCDKTKVVSETNDTDINRSLSVAIENGSPSPAVKLTVGSAGCIPIGMSTIFSKAYNMNPTKSCTIDANSGSLGTVANGAFCSAKMTLNSNSVQSVLSYSNTKSMVSDQVAVISTGDKLPVHRRHDESGKSTMMHEKGQNYLSNQMENGNCNIQSNLDADSMCITERHEKSNLKGATQSVPSIENSLTSVTLKDLEVQQKALIDQTREAASGEFVQYQVTECSDRGTGTESAGTTKNKDECNASRKLSLPNVSSLLKMNCMNNITSNTALENTQVDGNVPADCQTLNARPCFPKQNSLVKDTLMSQILPKLPSRRNPCRIVNSNHQNVVKSTVEHLCSDSHLNVKYKSEDLERSNILEPNDDPEEQTYKMQVSDCAEVESKTLDGVKPSCCWKSNAVHSLAIDKQQYKEVSSAPEQDINAIGQALVHSKTFSTVERRPSQKRAWSEEESGNACNKIKMMRTMGREGTESSRNEVCIAPVVQWEGVKHEIGEKSLPNLTTKSQESNSSLDSTKGDGTSAHAIPPKCNLNTSLVILEESELHKKLMDGEITVREFFKFFKVQIRAQKSRQSELHVNPELDKSSGLENWLAVKFLHRPKREVYEEEGIALSTAINDQNDQLLDLDKLLAEVNFPLLREVMQMTKEELQQFRSCLNAKKTAFMKRTKVICHEQKVQLYLSQLNALKAQRQQRKEYEDYLDDMLNKMDDCIASLDLGNLGTLGECSMDDIDHDESLMQLKQVVNERHEDLRNLQAEHSKMESELAKVLDEKSQQENAAKMLELNEEFQELLEWTLVPCQGDRAVYRFLYDSLELILQYGKAEGADLSPGEKCRILDVNLVSELDEEDSPAHSKLVHELILTYWKNRDSWHHTHSKESQLPMLLLDLSLVVSRCRLLGDELEYLLNWGAKFDISKTQIQHMDVKFLFSSYEALSKFEVTFHIMPGYPWLPLQFTFNSRFGNISGEHINNVLLTVKPGHEYLIRIVKSLFLTLLTKPGANRFVTTGLFLTRNKL
ncbi:kinetochore scaffold 1 isoform X3 [Amblyraja radiata]|uniref:kinetochore scaffold 1 isoform X3 n=1 Tax=Amblyraja radiata TaxID=386614 RepID=UPI001403A219|nr:kinetochore scaffold 1 isoform X3 [Amblyraja radiata]